MHSISPKAGIPTAAEESYSTIMVSSGPAPTAALVMPDWHTVRSRETPGQTSGPIPEAKGVMRNGLKVYYWLPEWKMLWVKGKKKPRSAAHIHKPRGNIRNRPKQTKT